jgi:hypothetical protein
MLSLLYILISYTLASIDCDTNNHITYMVNSQINIKSLLIFGATLVDFTNNTYTFSGGLYNNYTFYSNNESKIDQNDFDKLVFDIFEYNDNIDISDISKINKNNNNNKYDNSICYYIILVMILGFVINTIIHKYMIKKNVHIIVN